MKITSTDMITVLACISVFLFSMTTTIHHAQAQTWHDGEPQTDVTEVEVIEDGEPVPSPGGGSYVVPTLAFSGGDTNDVGETLANPVLTWVVNKAMTSREITGAATVSLGAGSSGSYTDTGANLTSESTYTLTTGDGTSTNSGTTTFYFYDRLYWGVNTTNAAISDAQIQGLTNTVLATNYVLAADSIIPVSDQYVWACWPVSWGTNAVFKLNGLLSTSWMTYTSDFVNAYGYTNNYFKARSPQLYGVVTSLTLE
jgi:hypothetical protein